MAGSADDKVAKLAAGDKLLAAARRATAHLPEHLRHDFETLFSPAALGATAAVLAGWAASHAFGVGFVFDLLLLVAGVAALGMVAVEAADELVSYVRTASLARNESDLDRAARHLAKAVALVGVQTFVALLTRRASARTHRHGVARVRAERLDQVVKAIGTKTHLPEVRRRVYTALGFLEELFSVRTEKGMNDLIDRLRCIDFSKPVEVVELPGGTNLVAWKQVEYVTDPHRLLQGLDPVLRRFEPLQKGLFYTRSGTPAHRLGISSEGRELVRYRTKGPVKVLQSTAAPARDRWSRGHRPTFGHLRDHLGDKGGELVGGGGVQFVVPDAKDLLEVVEIARPKI